MSEELWHTIATLDDRQVRSEAQPKREADELARNVICDPRVETVAVTQCSGEECFECACLRGAAALA